MPGSAAPKGRRKDQIIGRLRAADPFELIRWLARSQPDPRKALAELVQNSIDADASRIEIVRQRVRGVTELHVIDDGAGVIPEMRRTDALVHIATHVGHSRKRSLTPQERRELMMQGKYGIGLLGFWSIGQVLEMRSQIPGQQPQLLRLYEDSPRYEIEPLRGRLQLGERFTDVVIRNLHRPAFLNLSARRMADYLAAELRGQLLARNIEVVVRDRIARGRAPKVLPIQPVRFNGERLNLPDEIAVPGHGPVRIDLYLVPPGGPQPARVSISSGGTLVYDDAAHFEAADFRHPPWTDPRLNGLIEFPDFDVAPGTRRGVVPNDAALSFAAALRTIEPLVTAQMAEQERNAAGALEADVLRQLERVFRDVPRLAPEYDFFAVRARDTAALGMGPTPEDGKSSAGESPATDLPEGGALVMPSAAGSDDDDEEEAPSLLPGGALAALEITPAATRLERLGQRRLRAQPRDAGGVLIGRELEIEWSTDGRGWVQPARGTRVVFQAGPDTGTTTVKAVAREHDVSIEATAIIVLVDATPAEEARRTGIPEPVLVDEPGAGWRSRIRDTIWEVNSAHPDFRIAAEAARRKLRYLTALLAKEIVLHSFPAPQIEPVLERLVAVLTITDRRLERS